MNDQERGIVTGLVKHLAAFGWKCTSKNPVAVVEGTGQAWLAFQREKDGVKGWVLFIEGNGTDIVSDCSASTTENLSAFWGDVDSYLDTLPPS